MGKSAWSLFGSGSCFQPLRRLGLACAHGMLALAGLSALFSAGCNRGLPTLSTSPTGLLTLSSGPPAPVGPSALIPGFAGNLPVAGMAATPAAPGGASPLAAGPGTASGGNSSNVLVSSPSSELEKRMRTLDEANQQLTAQLAQAQQQLKLYQDRSELMQRQLADVTNQMQTRLAAGMAAATAVPRVATRDESTASTGSPSIDREFGTGRNRRSGARLSANVSRGLASEPLRDLGYEVDFSSDGLRLRIPSDQLFQPGTSQLTASGSTLLDRVAEVLRAHYADRRIAIEGYTDNSPMYGGIYATSHQLTSAQADQVLAHWTRSNRLSPSLLTTLAHGSNDPISDNQNPAGRAENRRIEIVVQSEVTP